MKKVILKSSLVIVLFLLFVPTGIAQGSFEYGVGFGLNYSKIKFRTEAPEVNNIYQGKIGFTFKSRFAEMMSSKFTLSVEPGISIFKSEAPSRSTTDLVSIDLPIKMEFRLIPRVSFNAGLSYNYITSYSFLNVDLRIRIDKISDNLHFINPIFGLNVHLLKNVLLIVDYTPSNKTVFKGQYLEDNGDITDHKVSNSFVQLSFVYLGF